MGATTRRRNSYALLSTMCDRVLPLKTCFLPSSCVGIWQKKSDRKPGNWCCEFNFEDIDVVIKVFNNKREMAKVAAEQAASILRAAIADHGRARLIAATGAAQFQFLEVLTALPDIDWQRVEMFHLDEYIGLPESHPASFRKFLQERLIRNTG